MLYGMIGLLGAKIWIENKVDFANPVNLVPIAAGIIIGVGGVSLQFGDTSSCPASRSASIVVIVGYHAARLLDARRGGSGVSSSPTPTPAPARTD